ncbi:hypothetical protein J3A83DRAFT_4383464 [Scleroderma citrinum]
MFYHLEKGSCICTFNLLTWALQQLDTDERRKSFDGPLEPAILTSNSRPLIIVDSQIASSITDFILVSSGRHEKCLGNVLTKETPSSENFPVRSSSLLVGLGLEFRFRHKHCYGALLSGLGSFCLLFLGPSIPYFCPNPLTFHVVCLHLCYRSLQRFTLHDDIRRHPFYIALDMLDVLALPIYFLLEFPAYFVCGTHYRSYLCTQVLEFFGLLFRLLCERLDTSKGVGGIPFFADNLLLNGKCSDSVVDQALKGGASRSLGTIMPKQPSISLSLASSWHSRHASPMLGSLFLHILNIPSPQRKLRLEVSLMRTSEVWCM